MRDSTILLLMQILIFTHAFRLPSATFFSESMRSVLGLLSAFLLEICEGEVGFLELRNISSKKKGPAASEKCGWKLALSLKPDFHSMHFAHR